MYDINTDEFRFVALHGPGATERKGDAVPSNVGILGAAAKRFAQPLAIADVHRDERFDPGIDGRVGVEPTSVIYVPLAHQGRLLGMLQLINRAGSAPFSAADGNVLSYVGEQLADFLYKARTSADMSSSRR